MTKAMAVVIDSRAGAARTVPRLQEDHDPAAPSATILLWLYGERKSR